MNLLKNIGLLLFTFLTLQANAQTDKATTAKIVEQKNFVFVATAAIPMSNADLSKVMSRMPGGSISTGMISLTGSDYDMRVTTDSLVTYLPYYGRAYSASYDNDGNGYKFTTKKFTYTTTKHRKGGWDIAISTQDIKDNVRMSLNITDNGYATLVVTSNNKQSITYNGYLKEAKK